MRKKKMTVKRLSQLEVLKHTPSELAKQAQLRRSAAGAHAADVHKKNRQKTRIEEKRAELGEEDVD